MPYICDEDIDEYHSEVYAQYVDASDEDFTDEDIPDGDVTDKDLDEMDAIEDAIHYLYCNKMLTDFKVISQRDNSQFHVHKLILALHSPVLSDIVFGKEKIERNELNISFVRISAVKNMISKIGRFFASVLSGNPRGEEKIDRDELNISFVGTSAIANMISYFYNKPLSFDDTSVIKETKTIAEVYQISGLCDICKNKFQDVSIEVSNVFLVLEMAAEYKDNSKERECFRLISRYVESVLSSETFMSMNFERGRYVLNTLREMGFLTEVQYLRTALSWVECENDVSKQKIMENIQTSKLSVQEFIGVINSYPTFFTNIEISEALKEIKTDNSIRKKIPEKFRMNTYVCEGDFSSDQESKIYKKKEVTIILEEKDDLKLAEVCFKDEIGMRYLEFDWMGGILEEFLLPLREDHNGHVFHDVDISFEGLYYLVTYLRNDNTEMSSVGYLEVLKAATFFELETLIDHCLMKVRNIIDYDPRYLDGLRDFPYFDDRLLHIIRSTSKCIILHPNFFHCSADLIEIILDQAEMDPSEEVQLLLVTITWLEFCKRLRWKYRSLLLGKIAFESIPRYYFKYVIHLYPNFFNDDETSSILTHKKKKNKPKGRVALPLWYSSKTRNFTSCPASFTEMYVHV